VSDAARQLRQADEFVRRLTAAVRANQLYHPSHPLAGRALKALGESAAQMLAEDTNLAVGFIENEIVVGEIPLVQAGDAFGELVRRVRQIGIERIIFDRDVPPEELGVLVETLAHPERAGVTQVGQVSDPLGVLGGLTRVRVGRLSLDERVEGSAADVATIRRLYTDGVSIAGALWEMTQREGMPDPNQAKALVDSLAQAVAQNRTALMALCALKDYDNYTFTHMVNVSILVMAQARSLGIDGTLLREFGLAALMHDIGKVRTPLEVLNKPDKLTDAEFAIMRMHVVDGAEILRRTPEIPALAPVVAFEHHLRLDGTGYPMGVKRASLNLGTMLCSISDVYDAMRSQRAYQGAYPSDRILAVLQKSDGLHFDQHLVRRFSQLMGLYPPGNMVRLDTGQIGVVIRTFAPDPRRPRVRVIIDPAGNRLPRPFDVSLWDVDAESIGPKNIAAPVDPKDFGIDPLTFL
jgi:putative nucleotidyltransferase with HDIG domain